MPSKNASQCVNMGSEERNEMLHTLDMRYRRTLHRCDLVVKDEEARRLKLRSIILRDEASALKDQLAQRDARIKQLVDQVDDVRSQLGGALEKSRRQDKLMQSQAREITNLKEELSAINAVSQDSARFLSEKLALSRELAVLKPELEHLRSQLTHQKDVLAEKLALERQLNTLEVELANEKRAAQKADQKQERESRVEEELRNQVRDLQDELAKEKRLAEKNRKTKETKESKVEGELQSLREQLAAAEEELAAEKRKAEQAENEASETSAAEEELEQLRAALAEARKALAHEKKVMEKLRKENEQAQVDAEERQQAMGDKVDRLRSKLRDTQEELKKCRAELEKAQARTVTVSSAATTTVPLKSAPGAKPNAKKKRSADEMSVDDKVLLTPGNMDDRPKRPLKKRGFDLSMVGGKSEFSITPFLNKTANLDGSPKPSSDDATPSGPVQFRAAEQAIATTPPAEPASEEPPTANSSAAKPTTKLVEKRPRGRPRTKPLAGSAASKKNLIVPKRKGPHIEPTLENVAEEPDDEGDSANHDQENVSASGGSATAKSTAASTTTASTTSAISSVIPEKAEPKKKKRKLLGTNTSTLFDGAEDEGERVKPAAGAAVSAAAGAAAGVKRPAVKVGFGTGAGVGKGMAAGRFGAGIKNAFVGTTFSPLKRDKRGAGASFLA
ncbi:hypothetical protein N657DRAFT_687157 [Parathielavia appendiculata]|uniref:Uncharacterized protein n=1 Tax=Parathielavia appendiculata TaxID=2587402 RepID=A0AAN6U5B5_9PEZI|nr:hypothetical protein N657DRAFT_687157 [Parathielavia appendiculata]